MVPQSSTVTFLSYWRGLQHDPQKAPARASFDPGRLKPLIPQMIMLSATEDGYPFRLSGGFLNILHARDLKERAFIAYFRTQFQRPVRAALRMAQQKQQPLVLTIATPWCAKITADADDTTVSYAVSHNETLYIEICLCPLTGPDGQLDRFVGIYQTYGRPPSSTRGKIETYSLLSSKIMQPQSHTVAAHLRLVSVGGQHIA
jgi:hypothetical protein